MINRTCKQCGKKFTITDSEIQFYKSKDLELPKRCSDCRKKNNNSSTKEINSNIGKSEDRSKHNKNKKNIFTSVIAGLLVILALFIGKVFNVDISSLWQDTNYTKEQSVSSLQFRNEKFLEDHFVKHGNEFGYSTKEEYLAGADGDDIYYDKNSNEIVFVSGDGYIRTYFRPSEGIDYYNRQ